MNPVTEAATPRAGAILETWSRVAGVLERLISHDVLALASRFGLAAIFFLSGRTKVDGFLTVTDSTYMLFREEYKVPLLPVEFAAHMATYAEHLFPLLLAIGLFTRFSALSLLGMTAVIQVFVYPDAWPTHLTWAAMALYVIGRGAGRASIDHFAGIR